MSFFRSAAGFIGLNRRRWGGVFTPPTPTPAPSFTVQPSISHDGTPIVGETLTGNDGTITNGTVSARQWLLNGSAISGATGASYVPDAAGDIGYRVTATGAGGSAQATSTAVAVAAAPTPTPTPTPTVLVNSASTSPVLIDTITTHSGDWPVYHLGDFGDLRVYRWAYSADPAWWAVSVNRLPDPVLTGTQPLLETLLTVTVDGVDHPVRVLPGSTKFVESHVPVTPSLSAITAAVASMDLPNIDGSRFTMFPDGKTLEPVVSPMAALGYKPDRIYGRDSVYDNAIGNVSSGTGENHSSRGFMSDNESILIAAALTNNQSVFDATAAAIHNEILWAMSMPHFMNWSPHHHMLRDPQIPFSGDLIYTTEGVAPSGGEALSAARGRWPAPADYPYLAEVNATAGTNYSHIRDCAHLFNHGWAYWFATGDPRVALVQNAIACMALGAKEPDGSGNYVNRFSGQRTTMNVFSAAYKAHKMSIASSAVIWPQARRTKFFNDNMADWQAKVAAFEAATDDISKRRTAFKHLDGNPTIFSYFMFQQYGALPAYFHAKEGKPELLTRLAEHFIIRVNDIGGRRGLQNDGANSNNGGNGSDLFNITMVTATTLAGMIAEIFDPRTSLPTDKFDGGSSGGACYIYMVLKFAQDAVARGWMAPVTGLDTAVANFEAQHAATTLTSLAHRTITSWRHCAVPWT